MTEVTMAALAEIDALQMRYIAALDAGDMDGWLDCFSAREDASYILTTAESVKADLPMALIMDDNRSRLKDRITYVTRIWKGIFAPYATRHFVQRTACRPLGEALYAVESNFLVVTTPSETGRAALFSTGIYEDCIELDAAGARLRSKKVVTDTTVIERFMVYPI